MNEPAGMALLLDLMEKLRHPEHGCRWDLKQSMQSLTSHTVEEVYEVVDAVEQGDPDKVCDELGDLLFQIVFYAQIASEQALFSFDDIAHRVHAKLLRRHPHVFPDGTLESFGLARGHVAPDQVEVNWESIKNAERGLTETDGNAVSVLDDVPRALPALDRARKLQKRAASIGFDWTGISPVFDKLQEEIDELQKAVTDSDTEAVEAELGDVLFTCVNLSRHLKVNAESALRGSNKRFEQRFRYVEKRARQEDDTSPEQLELWWESSKQAEKGRF